MKMFSLFVYFAILITLIIFGVIFAKDNTFLININLFGNELKAYPFWIVLFVSFICGAVFMFFIMFWEFAKHYLKKLKNNDEV